MSKCQITLRESFERDLKKLDKPLRRRIQEKVNYLGRILIYEGRLKAYEDLELVIIGYYIILGRVT